MSFTSLGNPRDMVGHAWTNVTSLVQQTTRGIGANMFRLYVDGTGDLYGQFEMNAPRKIASLAAGTEEIGVPVGAIFQWPSSTAPDGYLLCNGGSIGDNPILAGMLGNTYGGRLPNFSGRMIVGAGQPEYSENWPGPLSAGSVGGSTEVKLTIQQLPEHHHTIDLNVPDHVHPFSVPAHDHDHSLLAANHGHSIDIATSTAVDATTYESIDLIHSHELGEIFTGDPLNGSDTSAAAAFDLEHTHATEISGASTDAITVTMGGNTGGSSGTTGSAGGHQHRWDVDMVEGVIESDSLDNLQMETEGDHTHTVGGGGAHTPQINDGTISSAGAHQHRWDVDMVEGVIATDELDTLEIDEADSAHPHDVTIDGDSKTSLAGHHQHQWDTDQLVVDQADSGVHLHTGATAAGGGHNHTASLASNATTLTSGATTGDTDNFDGSHKHDSDWTTDEDYADEDPLLTDGSYSSNGSYQLMDADTYDYGFDGFDRTAVVTSDYNYVDDTDEVTKDNLYDTKHYHDVDVASSYEDVSHDHTVTGTVTNLAGTVTNSTVNVDTEAAHSHALTTTTNEGDAAANRGGHTHSLSVDITDSSISDNGSDGQLTFTPEGAHDFKDADGDLAHTHSIDATSLEITIPDGGTHSHSISGDLEVTIDGKTGHEGDGDDLVPPFDDGWGGAADAFKTRDLANGYSDTLDVSAGGSAHTHTLTGVDFTEVPNHSHTLVADGGHTHSISGDLEVTIDGKTGHEGDGDDLVPPFDDSWGGAVDAFKTKDLDGGYDVTLDAAAGGSAHTHSIGDHTHTLSGVGTFNVDDTLAVTDAVNETALDHFHKIDADTLTGDTELDHRHNIDITTGMTMPGVTGNINPDSGVDANTSAPTASIYISGEYTGTAGQSTPDPISTVPPYIAVYFIIKADPPKQYV